MPSKTYPRPSDTSLPPWRPSNNKPPFKPDWENIIPRIAGAVAVIILLRSC